MGGPTSTAAKKGSPPWWTRSNLAGLGAVGSEGVELKALQVYCLGCRVELALDGTRVEELYSVLKRAWSRCLTPIEGVKPAGTVQAALSEGGQLFDQQAGSAFGTEQASVLQNISQDVTFAVIAARAGELLMLHAGACADPVTGATVAFVAPGGTGKTTLASLLGRELGYLTDETVGITADGAIVAYPKPLSVRPVGGVGPKVETSPDELGLLPAPAQPWLKRLVLLRRDPGWDQPPRLTPLELGDAITELAPESSSLSKLPRPLHMFADLIGRIGPVLRCDYRDAETLAPLLVAEVSS